MGCTFKYFKFFRFRTPAGLTGYGVRADLFWMVVSLQLIDFNMEDLISGSILICSTIPGCFSFDNLKEMSYDMYDKILTAVKKRNDG